MLLEINKGWQKINLLQWEILRSQDFFIASMHRILDIYQEVTSFCSKLETLASPYHIALQGVHLPKRNEMSLRKVNEREQTLASNEGC